MGFCVVEQQLGHLPYTGLLRFHRFCIPGDDLIGCHVQALLVHVRLVGEANTVTFDCLTDANIDPVEVTK
ncbi:MAG: hypothetical protein CW742_07925 [Methanoregula sp.]|nr:MAG: hypothetical protein CW742_07925 [Methanoregula sp.]